MTSVQTIGTTICSNDQAINLDKKYLATIENYDIAKAISAEIESVSGNAYILIEHRDGFNTAYFSIACLNSTGTKVFHKLISRGVPMPNLVFNTDDESMYVLVNNDVSNSGALFQLDVSTGDINQIQEFDPTDAQVKYDRS